MQNLVGREAACGLRLAAAYCVAHMVRHDGLRLGNNSRDRQNRDEWEQRIPEASNHKFSLLQEGEDSRYRSDASSISVVEFWGNRSTGVYKNRQD